MSPFLSELTVADEPRSWVSAGFTVDSDHVCRVGRVGIRLVGSSCGDGIIGWSLGDLSGLLPQDLLDGVPTTRSQDVALGSVHPNGVTEIDHVVLMSPNLARTVESFATIGVSPRRERDGTLAGAAIRQIFFRLGETILEVVGSPETNSDGPSSLWGITYVVADIDASAGFFGENTSRVKEAVQPGRRITTVRNRELGVSVRTALISPHVRSAKK